MSEFEQKLRALATKRAEKKKAAGVADKAAALKNKGEWVKQKTAYRQFDKYTRESLVPLLLKSASILGLKAKIQEEVVGTTRGEVLSGVTLVWSNEDLPGRYKMVFKFNPETSGSQLLVRGYSGNEGQYPSPFVITSERFQKEGAVLVEFDRTDRQQQIEKAVLFLFEHPGLCYDPPIEPSQR